MFGARCVKQSRSDGGDQVRGLIYDATILGLTTRLYQAVLERLPTGARVLDVGVGTAGALTRNASLVVGKELSVVGIDIDVDYVDRAQKLVDKADLASQVQVHLASVYDFADNIGFDAVYYSSSFMLLPDPAGALRHTLGLLRPGGLVYFTQTFQEKRSPLMEKLKPVLKAVTTIDFGQVTYEADFRQVVADAGMELVELSVLSQQSSNRTNRIAIGRPQEGYRLQAPA